MNLQSCMIAYSDMHWESRQPSIKALNSDNLMEPVGPLMPAKRVWLALPMTLLEPCSGTIVGNVAANAEAAPRRTGAFGCTISGAQPTCIAHVKTRFVGQIKEAV